MKTNCKNLRKLCFSITTLLTSLFLPLSQGAILTVGSNSEHQSIGSALSAASSGDSISVSPGTYIENVSVAKNGVQVISANNASDTIIQGKVSIQANDVLIRGFTINNRSTTYSHGIYASSVSGLTVSSCTIKDGPNAGSSAGIYVRNSSKTVIEDCEIARYNKGINIVSSKSTDNTYQNGTTVRNNYIHDNPIDGIDLHGSYISILNNRIEDNIDTNWVKNHPDGIQLIAAVVDGQTSVKHCRIVGNTIKNHTQNIFLEGYGSTNIGPLANCYNIHIFNNVVFNSPGTTNGVNLDTIATKNIMVKRSKSVFIYNNTLGRCKNLSIYIDSQCGSDIHVKNNIISSEIGTAIWIDNLISVAASDLNHNIYGSNGNYIRILSTYYSSLSPALPHEYETNGIFSQNINNAFPTPTLMDDSIAIGKGEALDALYASDITGAPRTSGNWDIGAYNYSSAPTNAPPNAPSGLVTTE